MKASESAIVERVSRMHQLYQLLKDAEEEETPRVRVRPAAQRRA